MTRAEFDAAYARNYEDFLHLATAYLRDPGSMEPADFVHRVWVRIVSKDAFQRITGDDKRFRGYVHSLLIWEVYGYFNREAWATTDHIPDVRVDGPDAVLERAEHEAMLERLLELTRTLPQRDREVIDLLLHGFRQKDVGAMYGMSGERVRQVWGRALGRLRVALNKEG